MSFVQGFFKRALSTSSQVCRWHRDNVEARKFFRFGYKDNVKQSGPKPRLSNDSKPITQLRPFTPLNPFAPSQALLGQNDYIDILGHEDIHPARIHYHIPEWLRGFRHNIHFEALLRKYQHFESTGEALVMPKRRQMIKEKLIRYWRWQRVRVNQKKWSNYAGIKHGPIPNPYKSRYPF